MRKRKVVAVVVASVIFPVVAGEVNWAIATSFPMLSQSENANPSGLTQAPSVNLYEKGDGQIQIFDRQSQPVERALVTVRPNRSVDIAFGFSNTNRPLRLSGGLVSWSNNTLIVELTNSGDTGASGQVTVLYGENQSIYSISGKGRLNGRPMSIEFNGAVALSQTGRGFLTLKDGPSRNITKVSVTGQSKGSLDLVFFLDNGNQMLFSGNLASREADLLRIQLIDSRNVSASGTLKVKYGADNSIDSINGDGKLDGQDFSVQFSR